MHTSITPGALASIPHIRLSSQMWDRLWISTSESVTMTEKEVDEDGDGEALMEAIGLLRQPVDEGFYAEARLKAVIANASVDLVRLFSLT
ncbi:hypothetical protein DPMN_148728 [Dreissena polymorpha]|uniref:Uncharacterized protein n=1 Tax=Dreissena polymorpha TaxID=45954 RepID=A0A9D4FEL4_DREPO|nr:hypothetical protein DPMN_148728 [Dreissena polymorpha]